MGELLRMCEAGCEDLRLRGFLGTGIGSTRHYVIPLHFSGEAFCYFIKMIPYLTGILLA